ncbi:3'(2'),5'-bisphosphate nucleotidase CysQ [Jannaschia sp. Os4]|uniref:3'(2'),5'-bisphosphate nucleotidase CysQ n=1 Tax=Jannaschia sp. Os4 TaxID=2807617 RepID=UPI001939EA8E|nr:3'(2'),5'-bisphosphate nucleotidase CysQ [Jannaschia sp. Os4]MBM2575307.1 3'(2'),5'-bisphosphate nucleotidase CysQ [Jannaschia sp. Os4]
MPEPDDLALLVRAAEVAGEIAMRWFGRVRPRDKGDGQGPVTEADLEVDATLRAMLTEARPGYGWLSEESVDGPERLTRDRVFVVDPIDGTRAFIDGAKDWGHSLAVVEHGVPVAAVVLMPVRGTTYAAAAGRGATKDGAAMAPSGRGALEGATVLGAKANFRPERWREVPPVERTFRSSLAYRLALVAEGRFDAMITLRRAWEWDIAAGALLCAEAGAAVTDRRGGPLRFNGVEALLDGVVAGTPAVHGGLMERLA